MNAGRDVTIESLRPGDAERRWHAGRQAFGGTAEFDPGRPTLPDDQHVAAYDGDDLLGAMVTLDFVQTWGGAPVPCGGLSGVVVSPEARGLGLAKRMLAESFVRMGRRGQVVSALYPTTASLYRSMGYEVVCWYAHRRIPLAELDTGAASTLTWRRVPLDDPGLGDAIDHAQEPMVAAHDGWFRPDPVWRAAHFRSWATEKGVNRYAYVGARDGTVEAVVVYRYASADAGFYGLEAELLVGVDGAAITAALGFLAGHGTTAAEVKTTLPAPLLAALLPQVQRCPVVSDWPLMLRIVDAPGAVAARGWPAGVTGRVELSITDEVLPANAGHWVLEVDGGEAELTPGGSGRIALTAQHLAVLYAGGAPRLLHSAGRLAGSTSDDRDLLAAAFTSSPSIATFF